MDIGEIGNVGEREVVFVQTFIIPRNETLEFSFSPTHPGPQVGITINRFTLNVKVRIAGKEDEEISAEWRTDNKAKAFVLITFPVVSNKMGPAITESPIRVGEVAGKQLGFFASYSPSPWGASLITIQFVLGGKYGSE